jgi:hypothetical protein
MAVTVLSAPALSATVFALQFIINIFGDRAFETAVQRFGFYRFCNAIRAYMRAPPARFMRFINNKIERPVRIPIPRHARHFAGGLLYAAHTANALNRSHQNIVRILY